MTHMAQWVYLTNLLKTAPIDEFNLLKVLCYLQFLNHTKYVPIVLNHFL